MKPSAWRQIGGDQDPGTHGGLIARFEEGSGPHRAVELILIQPTREYVGARAAMEVGFPFWSRQARYEADDMYLEKEHVLKALKSSGYTVEQVRRQPA